MEESSAGVCVPQVSFEDGLLKTVEWYMETCEKMAENGVA